MTRTEFLAAIAEEIGFLPPHKRRQVMAHFSSLFTGCDADLDIIEKLGAPEDALREYLTATKRHQKSRSRCFS